MDLRRRMELLADSALADREGVPQLRRPSPVGKHPLASVGIAAVRMPGGGCTSLMRVMQTNACSLSCGYLPDVPWRQRAAGVDLARRDGSYVHGRPSQASRV